MLSLHILSFLLGFALFAHALPQPSPYRPWRPHVPSRRLVAHTAVKQAITEAMVIPEPAFLISNFTATSNAISSNLSLSFTFADPNSNTSTTCSSTWTETNTTSTRPMGPSYQVCTDTHHVPKKEYFKWYFDTYTSVKNFTIELAHQFSDPEHYKEPYDYVQYFASANVTLTCGDAAGRGACTLPSSTSPIVATITSLSN